MDSINSPLISVVFTSYNHKEFLIQALDSLVNQTYPNLEIIIVDDCSTDGSQEVLECYNNLPNFVIKLQQVNSGSYVKASNYGASLANGEYLLFAQCDDFSAFDQIEKLYSKMDQTNNIGVVFSKSNLVDKYGNIFSNDFIGREKKFKNQVSINPIITGKKMKEYLSFSCVIPNLSAALIKHDLYKQVNGLSESYLVVSDWQFWLDLTEFTNFYYLGEALNNFRQHDSTIRSIIKIKVQMQEIFNMFNEHINKYNLTEKEVKQINVNLYAILISYFFENKILWLRSFPSLFILNNKNYFNSTLNLFFGGVKYLKNYISNKLG